MRKREFRAAAVSALTGKSTNMVLKWAQSGLLRPRRGKPRGNPKGGGRAVYFSERDAFIACVIVIASRRGLTLAYCRELSRFLNGLTIEEIADAAAERKVLVFAGAATSPALIESGPHVIGETSGQAGAVRDNEITFTLPLDLVWEKYRAGVEHFDRHLAAPLN